ncbi:AAA family ATPase [Shivajiella indica]|uniref:AAA family ATPase n=1 Tax=Shivajiella indica TaxID=872115 RepID=A0ABW5B6B9_9BACT
MELKRTPRIPQESDLNRIVENIQKSIDEDRKQATSHQIESNPILRAIRESKIDPLEEIKRPPVCLSMFFESGNGVIGTLGNFSLIIGKAKSKKTFSISMFLASVINGNAFNKFQGQLPIDRNRVIFFDTEQSKYHVSKFHKRVCKLAGKTNPENFDSYSLRKHSVQDRLKIIDYVINNTPDLGFVAIDGIRDLVMSINDEEEATKIASYLLKWTEEKNIHIITVLHQNKGDNNARGHVGTELVNKAETVLSVTLDQSDRKISIVEPEFCRDKEPEPFAFSVDENGLPFIIENWSPRQKNENKALVPHLISAEEHWANLKQLFEKYPEPKGKDVVAFLKSQYNIGDNKAKEFRTYYLDQEWIRPSGNRNSPINHYILSLGS